MNNYRCDFCGCYLNLEHWKECDKCNGKDTKRNRKYHKEVTKHESGTQDD